MFLLALGTAALPASAQLFSTTPMNTKELQGYAPPKGYDFSPYEFWAFNRWRKIGDPASTFLTIVSVDRGQLSLLADDATNIAGLALNQPMFGYSALEAQMDAVSAGRATGAIWCGAHTSRASGKFSANGTASEISMLGQVRNNMGWMSFSTHAVGAVEDSALMSTLTASCAQTVQDGLNVAPPAGWEAVKPQWLHSVATWDDSTGRRLQVRLRALPVAARD